ncbi:MAG: VanZ family protein [Sulfuritalea sp.]|nr:VanZ family protein [Sulfuritalea sp.]
MAERDTFRGEEAGARFSHLFLGWLAYLVFVIYGSLVPLDFQPMPLGQAWSRFQQIPMLQIGVQGRADWVANGVLYVPVGFLSVALFAAHGSVWRRLPLIVGATLFAFALAVGVEFAQIFFPARTVSRNDVIAEWIGSVLGIVLAIYWADWFRRLLATLSGKLDQVVAYTLQGYAACYLAFSFFPYDFLLSATELTEKLESDAWGWFLAGMSTERGVVVLAAKLLAEILALMPIGLLLGRRNESRRIPVTSNGWLLGALLGLFIETVQFFVYSGIAQGASLLTRAAGVYFGAVLWRERGRLGDLRHSTATGRILRLFVLLYLPALAAVNGWFDHAWHGLDAAKLALTETRFLPFYYHYFTTEQAALVSLVSVALMYAPIGVLAWLRCWSPAAAVWLAMLAALGIESSKLFLSGTHADPTNVLIAAMAAWGIYLLLARFVAPSAVASAVPAGTGSTAGTAQAPTGLQNQAHESRPWPHWLLLAPAAVFCLYWLLHFPVMPWALGLGLAGVAGMVWVRPLLGVALIPAALPILDLAPWSGRFFLDEFDILLLVVLAVGFARVGKGATRSRRYSWADAALWLLLLSFFLSTLRALLPPPTLDANSFSSYLSAFNALRIGKGLVWALLIAAFVRRVDPNGQAAFDGFARGIVVGLAVTVAVVVREKMLFGGLLDFSTEYRATGPFSAIHTGGAYIEGFLVAAAPFLIYLTVRTARWHWRAAGTLLLLGTTYAIVATVSRGGLAAFVIACGLALLATLAGRGRRLPRLGQAAVLVGLVLAVALPLLQGTYVQERLANSGSDLKLRQAHWRDALAMRDDNPLTRLVGMGIGKFPVTHYLRSREAASRSSIHSLAGTPANPFLRLGPGSPLYVEQMVALEPGRSYRLAFDVRSELPAAQIGVGLCEKWMLASHRCAALPQPIETKPGNGWRHREYTIESGELGSGGWIERRPAKLSLFSGAAAVVEIDNVRLAQVDGPELTVNGGFAQGMDRWFFATDFDLAWHMHSTPVAILFDQGWFGVMAWALFVVAVLVTQVRLAWRGDTRSGTAAAAFVGLGAVSLLGATIDSPRFLLLMIVLAMLLPHRVNRREAEALS